MAGAFIGGTNIPERWFPGKLDLIFNSHHLMHVMVSAFVHRAMRKSVIIKTNASFPPLTMPGRVRRVQDAPRGHVRSTMDDQNRRGNRTVYNRATKP